jgi:hypothetical protein
MALAVLAVALSGGVAKAGKPGGRGPIPPETGTIYFSSNGARWSMNPDGSGKTALPASVFGVPSNQRHGGAHWFLYYNGQIHAIREDGSSDVQLWSQTTGSTGAPGWGRDDSFVSFFWGTAGDGYRLYRIAIAFDANGVPSAAGGPIAVPGIVNQYGNGFFPHTWSPTGDRVAWFASDSLNVTTVATGATTSIASETGYAGGGLAWSPDGARILFGTGVEIHTIDPSGANRRKILSGTYGRGNNVHLVATDWSPDSAAIVYRRDVYELVRYRDYRGRWENDYDLVDADVYRASADGSATENLTSELSSLASPIAWR